MPTPPTEDPVKDPHAAELTASGHWAETQVIESIKEATFRHQDPRRVLNGRATQLVGNGAIFHPAVGAQQRLVTPKPSLLARLRGILKFLKS